jgi:hypothetical protein
MATLACGQATQQAWNKLAIRYALLASRREIEERRWNKETAERRS